MLLGFIKRLFFGQRACGHSGRRDSQTQRTCLKCGREQTVYANRFPGIEEAEYVWDDSPNQRLMDLL